MNDQVTSSFFVDTRSGDRPARSDIQRQVQTTPPPAKRRGQPVIVTMIVTSVAPLDLADAEQSIEVTADIAWTNGEHGSRHRSLLFSIPIGNASPAVSERIREAGARFVVEDARAAGVLVGHCGMSVLLFGVVDS